MEKRLKSELIAAIKEELKDDYLMSFIMKTTVVIFLPEKYEALQEILSKLSVSHAGCCYYFLGYSVALWQDLEDAIGFRGDVVCALEIFEGDEINREFYWRYKVQQSHPVEV